MRSFPKLNVPTEVNNSLRKAFAEAWDNYSVIVFTAPCGCGKTTTAHALLEDKLCYYIDVCEGFEASELVGARNADCLVIDNTQDLEDDHLINCVRAFIKSCPNMRLIALTRGAVPGWLVSYRIRGMVRVFTEEDLSFDATAAARLIKDYGGSIGPSDLSRLLESSGSAPVVVAIAARKIAEGQCYDKNMKREISEEIRDFFFAEVFNRLDYPTRKLVGYLSLFDYFTPEMARWVLGDEKASLRMEHLRKTNAAFEGAPGRKGALRMKTLWVSALRNEVRAHLSSEELEEIYMRAGSYYARREEVADALACFEKAGRQDMVRQQLIDNTRCLVSIGSYRDAEPYYLRMTEEEVLASPMLTYGMSILCSLQMRPEEGEMWRERLLEFADDENNKESRRREARMRHSFLKLLLPQFTTENYIDSVLEVCRVLDETRKDPPAASLVRGAPSLMGGVHDFSALLRAQNGDIRKWEPEFERVFGAEGRFFTRYVGIEYDFARGKLKKSQLHELSRALPAIRREKLRDIEFAVTSLIARGELSFGNGDDALKIVDAMFETLSKDEGGRHLEAMLKALRCRIALYTNNETIVSEWFVNDRAPLFTRPLPEMSYLYMTQALVYVARGDYQKALYAADAVEGAAVADERTLNIIFVKVMTAICQYQLGEEWQISLQEAIDVADDFDFISAITQFGDVVQVMLTRCEYKASDRFREKLEAFAKGEKYTYPSFFKQVMVLESPLTQTEQRVLELLCEDKSNADICRILDIKLPTVKTHVSHIFAKLGCKRRAEARSTALKLGLV